MTKIQKVTFHLHLEQIINSDILKQIKDNGYSRVPICDDENPHMIIGFLLTKSLIGLETLQGKTLK